ncbi:MAG: 2-amino-4-hydroxy-6-hydroxymethyldihydropteridine diphosphokinase [Rhodothalassiaceae bacterium]
MIHIALGSNLASPAGPPRQTLDAALTHLEGCGIRVMACSPFYESAALGTPDPQPPYVNAVAAVSLRGATPETLLSTLLAVERAFGRRREGFRAARTLDLDLLDWHGEVLPDPESWRAAADGEAVPGPLFLPHPRLHRRRFVLAPLADLAPCWRHPVLGTGITALLAATAEQELRRLD